MCRVARFFCISWQLYPLCHERSVNSLRLRGYRRYCEQKRGRCFGWSREEFDSEVGRQLACGVCGSDVGSVTSGTRDCGECV